MFIWNAGPTFYTTQCHNPKDPSMYEWHILAFRTFILIALHFSPDELTLSCNIPQDTYLHISEIHVTYIHICNLLGLEGDKARHFRMYFHTYLKLHFSSWYYFHNLIILNKNFSKHEEVILSCSMSREMPMGFVITVVYSIVVVILSWFKHPSCSRQLGCACFYDTSQKVFSHAIQTKSLES